MTRDENAAISLDEEKVKAAELWDGLHGIITNIPDDNLASLIARYACLWVIEESFRVNKHTLQMRPIFHWKPHRIHTHIALWLLCLAQDKWVRLPLQKNYARRALIVCI